jgi:hypothetical protein
MISELEGRDRPSEETIELSSKELLVLDTTVEEGEGFEVSRRSDGIKFLRACAELERKVVAIIRRAYSDVRNCFG